MEAYKLLLKDITSMLKEQDFKKVGSYYYYQQDNNIGILSVQKSLNSSSSKIKFTINVGVFCTSIYRFIHYEDKKNPTIDNCHWKTRIGLLMPENEDKWWIIENDSDTELLRKELFHMMNFYVIPAIKNHITDNQLEKYWLDGKSDGLTEYQRYVYLTILLKLKKSNILPSIIERFEEYGNQHHCQGIVKVHVKDLNIIK